MRTKLFGSTAIACTTLFLSLASARAQEPAAGETPPAAGEAPLAAVEAPLAGASADPAPVPPNTARPEPQPTMTGTTLRQACEAEIRDNAEWRTELKENLATRLFEAPQSKRDEELRDMVRREAHEAETERMLRDKQHVVYAYGALWILTALFVLYMFVRQRSLDAEIARLRREVAEATES